MHTFVIATVAMCCWGAAQARPGGHGGGHEPLEGIPDLGAFGKITYPKFDILELGEYSKGHLPPKVIVSHKEVTIKVPKPYPVKVPHPVPVPYPVAKPYPVVETKVVKVPHPVPYEVVKKVAVPVEVPKPYPVPVNEHHGGSEGHSSEGAGHGVQVHAVAAAIQVGGGHEGGYESFGGGHNIHQEAAQGHEDQSQGYGESFSGAEHGHQELSHQPAWESHRQDDSFGQSFQGAESSHQQLSHDEGQHFGNDIGSSGDQHQLSLTYGVPGQEHGTPLGSEEYSQQSQGSYGVEEGHAADQSGAYSAALTAPQPNQDNGWSPMQTQENQDQKN